MQSRERLRIAIQKSGRLADASQGLLAQCGFSFRQSRDKLFCFGETHPVDLLLVRDDDIPGLIAEGVCDLGIVGRNVLEEHGLQRLAAGGQDNVRVLRPLGFGACRLSIAIPLGQDFVGLQSLSGLRIATSYPQLLGCYLGEHGVTASIVVLSGSVEIAPRLGTADVICDLVSSGATLAANQLQEVLTILQSEAVLAAGAGDCVDARSAMLQLLLRRIDGVMAVRETRMLMLRASRSSLAAVRRSLPTTALTTVIGVDAETDQLALQVLIPSSFGWPELEAVQAAGATRLVVLPVERMLA